MESTRKKPTFLERFDEELQSATISLFEKYDTQLKALRTRNAGSEEKISRIFVKIPSLVIILNSEHGDQFFKRVKGNVLIEPHFFFMATNVLADMQEGFNIAKESQVSDASLLQSCAMAADAENFRAFCKLMELELESDRYVKLITQADDETLLQVAPLYFAAFCGNLSLLRDLCPSLNREFLTSQEKVTGLTLMHFAVMGGDVDTVEYLHRDLNIPLDKSSRMGVTPFAYAGLSNNPEMVKKFFALKYQPSKDDVAHFNALYLNDITSVRKKYATASDPAHDMPYVLRELMADPTIKADKEISQTIEALMSVAMKSLDDLMRTANDAASMSDERSLGSIKSKARHIVEVQQVELFLCLDNPEIDKLSRDAIAQADRKLNAKLNEFENIKPKPRRSTTSDVSVSSNSSKLSFNRPLASPPRSPIIQRSAVSTSSATAPAPIITSSSTRKMMPDEEWERRRRENAKRIEIERDMETASRVPRITEIPDYLDLVDAESYQSLGNELTDFSSVTADVSDDEVDEKDDAKSRARITSI